MRRQIAALTGLMILATLAFGHGDVQHILGTVTEVSDRSITVETINHQKVTVAIGATTKFMKGKAAGTLKDVKSGYRVVIDATQSATKDATGRVTPLQAQTVRIGTGSGLPDHGGL